MKNFLILTLLVSFGLKAECLDEYRIKIKKNLKIKKNSTRVLVGSSPIMIGSYFVLAQDGNVSQRTGNIATGAFLASTTAIAASALARLVTSTKATNSFLTYFLVREIFPEKKNPFLDSLIMDHFAKEFIVYNSNEELKNSLIYDHLNRFEKKTGQQAQIDDVESVIADLYTSNKLCKSNGKPLSRNKFDKLIQKELNLRFN